MSDDPKMIVVLKGYTPIRQRTFWCNVIGDAERLSKFLNDAKHPSMAATVKQWEAMQAETFKDWPKEWGWS